MTEASPRRGALSVCALAAGALALALWLELQGWIDRALRLIPVACALGLALWSVQRARRDQGARIEAEQAATHFKQTTELRAALGRSKSAADVIDASIKEALFALLADAGMLLLVGGDGMAVSAACSIGHRDDGQSPDAEVSLTARSPLADAVKTARPVILESSDAWRGAYPDAPAILRLPAYSATAVVPLVVAGRVVAIARFDFSAPRTFTAHDREFLDVFSRCVAQALHHAWQDESALRALRQAEALRERADRELQERQRAEVALRASETQYRALAIRTARMHELAAALSEAVTVSAVTAAVVQHGGVLVGAADGAVVLLDGDAAAIEDGSCVGEAVQTRRPVLVSSWAEAPPPYWRSASTAANAGHLASVALPLIVDGNPVGAVEFHFSAPVLFDAEYQALLTAVAHHCSQALDRARLYEFSQRARVEAETASRLKDEFLSILSHELRTPLNAVLGWASMLRQRPGNPEVATRAVQSIFDNAMRQATLIEDLLDVSRMMTGQVTLDVQDIDLATLITGVVESMTPTAVSNDVEVSVTDLPRIVVRGDRRRLEQVFSNLLGNAVKFTPPGGRVRIDASRHGGAVKVCVRDTGIGIEPEFLPCVFERFRQRDSSPTRSHGGLGLGLSIAKQLVDAHAGRLIADSAGRGQGTTFSVELPLAGPDGRQSGTLDIARC